MTIIESLDTTRFTSLTVMLIKRNVQTASGSHEEGFPVPRFPVPTTDASRSKRVLATNVFYKISV